MFRSDPGRLVNAIRRCLNGNDGVAGLEFLDMPRKDTILAARDHLLQRHTNLKVVGAHLGSMEVDVDQIAQRFDRYPNFAVDTAARVEYLMMQTP